MSEDSLQKRVFSGLVWKFGERILAQGISFVVSIVLARILLPEEYGLVSMVTVFILIADVFVTSGFSTALIQKKDADETDFSSIFWCTLAVSVLLYLMLFFGAPLLAGFYRTEALVPIIRVFGIKILISAINSVQHAYVSRHMLFRKFFFSTLGGTVVSGIVGIAMALTGCGVWALVVQYLLNAAMDTVILGLTVNWRPRLLFSAAAAKSLMRFGWKVLAADLIGTLYNNLRALLIGRYYTSADLAYYNRGKQFPELISSNVDATISSVLFPAMSNASDDRERVKALTRRSMTVTAFVIFPVMLGMATVARPLVAVLLTEKWADCVLYLQLICIAKAMMTVSTANLQAMRAIGRSDVVLRLEFIKKPVGLILIFAALRHSMLAAAVTMPIYSAFAMLVNMWPNRKLLGYRISEQLLDLLSVALMTGLMSLSCFLVSRFGGSSIVQLLARTGVGVTVYLLTAYLSKNKAFFYLISLMKGVVRKRNDDCKEKKTE